MRALPGQREQGKGGGKDAALPPDIGGRTRMGVHCLEQRCSGREGIDPKGQLFSENPWAVKIKNRFGQTKRFFIKSVILLEQNKPLPGHPHLYGSLWPGRYLYT